MTNQTYIGTIDNKLPYFRTVTRGGGRYTVTNYTEKKHVIRNDKRYKNLIIEIGQTEQVKSYVFWGL